MRVHILIAVLMVAATMEAHAQTNGPNQNARLLDTGTTPWDGS